MLIYNNLLCYLAAEYMDTIIYSGLFKKEFEPRSTFNALLGSKKIKEEDEIDNTIHSLENEILMLLLIKKRKRRYSSDENLQISKCLHKYDTSNK